MVVWFGFLHLYEKPDVRNKIRAVDGPALEESFSCLIFKKINLDETMCAEYLEKTTKE